jgi:hypothetical protein
MADFFSGLLGIGDEQDPVAAAQRAGMLGIASGLLGAGGPSLMPTSLGAALGSSIMGGRQVAQQSLSDSMQRLQQQQKMREQQELKAALPGIFVDGKPDYAKLQQLVVQFPEMGGKIADALQKSAGPETIQVDVGNEVQIRTKQGDIVARIPKGVAPQAAQRETFGYDKDLGMFVGSLGSIKPAIGPDGKPLNPKSQINLDAPTSAFMSSTFGTTDFSRLTPEQQTAVQIFKNAPNAKDAEDLRVKAQQLADETGIPAAPIFTREQLLTLGPNILKMQGQAGGATGGTTGGATGGEGQAAPRIDPNVAVTPLNPNEVPLVQSAALPQKVKRELELARPQTMGAVEYVVNTNRQMRDTINQLLTSKGLDDAFGFGGKVRSAVPGSAAADALAKLEQLGGNLFVEAITAMRAASKTGAAVGSATEREGDKLQASRAALQQFQSSEAARKELGRLLKQLEDAEDGVVNAYNRTYGQSSFKFSAPTPSTTNRPPLGQIFQ